jgi:hypothetical protein
VPDPEVDMFKSLDAVGGVVVVDEALAGLDDKIREKLIAQDKLKAEKVKEKTQKGKDKKTNVQDEVTSTVLDEVL